MALSVKIPKEILDYKPKTAFGFTTRQFISIIYLIIIAGISAFFYVKLKFSTDFVSYIIIFFGFPGIIYGFAKPHNYFIEEYIKIIINHRFSPYQRFNSYYKKSVIKNSKKDLPENFDSKIFIDIKKQKKQFRQRYKLAVKDFKHSKKLEKRRLKLDKKQEKNTRQSSDSI